MGIPISHWKVASFCLCGLIWWSLPVTCFLWSKGIFQRMCCFTWHAEEPESLRCVDCKSSKTTTERWLTRRLGFFCWMSMIQQTPSTKWIQNGVSCLCFLKENSKPKVWIQKELRVKLVFHEIKEVGIGIRLWSCCPLIFLKVLLLWWSEALSLRSLPQGVNELLVSFRACIRSIHWVNVSKCLPKWFNEEGWWIYSRTTIRFFLK